jgi:hypothetical protein
MFRPSEPFRVKMTWLLLGEPMNRAIFSRAPSKPSVARSARV